jgi:hypothetical protein
MTSPLRSLDGENPKRKQGANSGIERRNALNHRKNAKMRNLDGFSVAKSVSIGFNQ